MLSKAWVEKWFDHYPERYKAVHRGVGYAFTLLGAAAGIVFWIVSGFRSREALVLTAVCVSLFFLIRYLMKNMMVPKDWLERKTEPEDLDL
ncbi:MAG: hypothetical protein IJP98_05690 [Clostridia bacterium]|nr:hypothetical protein [Clostridia bacterium]